MNIKGLTHAVAFAATVGIAAAAPAFAESTNSQTFQGWANDTAVQYNGRIPRDVYMNEMGRRWDTDANHRGTRDAYVKDLGSRWEKADRDNRRAPPRFLSGLVGTPSGG